MRLLSSDWASSSSSGRVVVVMSSVVSSAGVNFRIWYCFDDVVDVEEEEGGG